MENKATLLIMAAGMGSRFGGLKQIEPMGPNGEILLDFSVFDAKKAGFDKVVFIIRKDIEKDFREIAGKRIEKMVDVEYAMQSFCDIPEGFSVPAERTKPLGTGHAVYCARKYINSPFGVINADDYYGRRSFEILANQLKSSSGTCMVGFRLENTLTENGTVARGVCEVENGYLKSITEHTALDRNSGIPLDKTVSMNMWGFMPDIFKNIEGDFIEFLKNMKNPLKDEFFIPTVVDNMINRDKAKVKVLSTPERWYGVTYKEDKETVSAAMNKLISGGFYDGI